MDSLTNTGQIKKFIKSVGGRSKTTRHRYAEVSEIADHFAEGSIFAANSGNIVHAQLV